MRENNIRLSFIVDTIQPLYNDNYAVAEVEGGEPQKYTLIGELNSIIELFENENERNSQYLTHLEKIFLE